MKHLLLPTILVLAFLSGCASAPAPYGSERTIALPGGGKTVWAVAPALNISGQAQIDPLLQADLIYDQLQQVEGVTVIPVNRVAEVFASLRINQVQSEEQAAIVCDLLGCDGLLVPTVTAFDPYNPPKFGASLQLFIRPPTFSRPAALDPRELTKMAAPEEDSSLPKQANFVQAVGLFDAANGTTRESLQGYAAGRHDPEGPMREKEYFINMDRYCGFVYFRLIEDLLTKVPN